MIVTFETQLALTNDPQDDGEWFLLKDFVCNVDGIRITVPAGFETDLASTPRILWSWMPPFGRWDESAVMHDYLYRNGIFPERKTADNAFYAGMLACGVPRWRAYMMWLAVRMVGGKFYQGAQMK